MIVSVIDGFCDGYALLGTGNVNGILSGLLRIVIDLHNFSSCDFR